MPRKFRDATRVYRLQEPDCYRQTVIGVSETLSCAIRKESVCRVLKSIATFQTTGVQLTRNVKSVLESIGLGSSFFRRTFPLGNAQ